MTGARGEAQSTAHVAQPTALRLSLMTGVSRYLSPEDPFTSFVLEPTLRAPVFPRTQVQAGGRIDRPFDSHENYRAPRVYVSLTHAPDLVAGYPTRLTYRLSALDLDRWSADGYVLRHWLGFEAGRALAPWLTLRLTVAPWLQQSGQRLRTNGAEIPGGGFQERLQLAMTFGRFSLDLFLTFEQARASAWRNEYSTFERLQYHAADWVAVGVSHELVTSVVDDSTGVSRPFRLADGRESLVSLFAEWRL